MTNKEFAAYVEGVCAGTIETSLDSAHGYITKLCAQKLHELHNDGYISMNRAASLLCLVDPIVTREVAAIAPTRPSTPHLRLV